MTRCPACAYHFGPRDGAPSAIGEAFSEDLRCPECGLPIPAGSRVVVGSASAYAVGAKLSWGAAWPFVVLGGAALFFWIPEVYGAILLWLSGGGPPSLATWLLLVGILGQAVGMLGFVYVRRARKQRGVASEEAAAPHERVLVSRGWMFAPGWMVVFNRAARSHSVEVIDARLVRSVRARRCAESGEGLDAACEISARLLPPGPPAASPVHLRIDGSPAGLSAAFDASLRVPASVDLAERLGEWRQTDGGSGLRVSLRRAAPDVHRGQRAAIEMLDDGRVVIVRGSPAEVAPVPAEAVMRSLWLPLVAPTIGLAGGAYFIGGSAIASSPSMIIVPACACAVSIGAIIVLPWYRKRSAYAEQAEWRVSSTGIVIARGKSATRLDRSTVRAIELVEPSGVPQLVIRVTRSNDAYATLVPDNWARLAPETVLEQIRLALRGG